MNLTLVVWRRGQPLVPDVCSARGTPARSDAGSETPSAAGRPPNSSAVGLVGQGGRGLTAARRPPAEPAIRSPGIPRALYRDPYVTLA